MATYALIQSNAVINIIAWDGVTPVSLGTGVTAQLLSSLPAGAGVGWTFNGSVWSAPAAVAQTSGLTFQQFVALFTVAEFNAIVSASIANPAITIGMWKLLAISGNINLASQLVVSSVAGLVTLSLLTAARQTAVLAGTVVNPQA